MAIVKVWVDDGECTGCGICEDSCPEVFELNDVAEVKQGADFNQFGEKIRQAAEDCPSEAIHFEEE